MLALKLAPTMKVHAETVTVTEAANEVIDSGVSVFDELDSGVGARIGARIGGALQRLASEGGQQVICVTHLPQVAAHGRAVQVEPMKPVLKASGSMLVETEI